ELMEEISPAVALTLSLANTMCDSGISSTLDITELDNVTDAVNMLCDQNGEVEYTMEEDEVVTASEVVISLPEENHHHNVARGGSRSVYELDCIPLWGTVSIRGERSEMEDAVRALPQGMSPSLTHLTSHFFGVYDGHGGLQVKGKINRPVVGAYEMVLEAVSPETVGSTAVVALVCSSHIIVSNCGDSRAVLLRGKESMPLSVDHKPDREDEYARIERAGGKVIQWQGARVSGVLAMSRSIGDQYLEPYVIPEPEVTFMPRAREDECLILASDGLWDVMSNQDACEFARRRILWWHRKNGALPLAERGVGEDQACQAAADYLSKLALQKGSRDNISVIVVDLKAQRKLKIRA
ncbi:hypothetical protein HID58_081292, partial [Brassica napus]